MRLVIGGCAQGKLDYVFLKYQPETSMVWDGCLPDNMAEREGTVVIDHLHCWVRQCLMDGRCPEEEIFSFLDRHEDCIIISDEVGNGIVPADSFEREYRERVGRLLVRLAGKAEGVERVICGIGQRIK